MGAIETYGQLTYDNDSRSWVVEAKPHVVLRLKRCFAKIGKHEHGQQFLKDTTDTARDLAWFLERFPLKVSKRDLARLHARRDEHIAQEQLVHEVLGGHKPPPAFELAVPLRDYQKTFVTLALSTGAVLNCDDMGLGKTAQAIGVFARPDRLPALVLTLPSLPEQWRDQIRMFAPQLRVHILAKAKPYDLRLGPRGVACKRHRFVPDKTAAGGARCTQCECSRDDAYHGRTGQMPDVIISNYHKLPGWADVFGDPGFGLRTFVLDEAQEVRHPETARYSACKYVRQAATTCIGLSGTPIYNTGIEYFNVMEIVKPDVLGTRAEFVREWCRTDDGRAGTERIQDTRAFGTYLREQGFMLRRTRAEVGRELPPFQNVLHRVESDERAFDNVRTACAELARIILSKGPKLEKGTQWKAAEEFSTKLRQATGIAKAPYVAEFVRMIVESGEPVLCYAWHHAVFDILRERLRDLGPVMFTGLQTPKQKQESKRAFLAGETKLMFMSLRAGAGLDGLQAVCSTPVYAEFDYSPGVHAQCTCRLFRDGQSKSVFAYYPYVEEGSDPPILDILGVKNQQLLGVRDPDADIVEELTVDSDHVKKLASYYLTRAGIPLPAEPTNEASAEAAQ